MSNRSEVFERLVRLLADGAWVSGEQIGDALGISRSGVWKRLHTFGSYGLHVESVKGKGYRLAHPLNLLNAEDIRLGLAGDVLGLLRELHLPFETASTNAFLMGGDRAPGSVCIAEYQSSGKGRRGRQWQSPLAANLTMSVTWSFSGGVAVVEGLSLAVGVAVADALSAMGIDCVGLKWPNDLVCDGRKLGGILIELVGDASGECDVVVGLGLNVAMSEYLSQALIPSIDQPWVDLCQLDLKLSRNQLAAEILNRLLPLLASYEERGFLHYRDRWMALNAHRDQMVCLSSAAAETQGRFVSVSASGALVLETEAGREQFSGGELSLRPVL